MKIFNKFTFFLINGVFILLFTGCCSNETNQETINRNVLANEDNTTVQTLCELTDNSYYYDNKIINLKTTLSKIDSTTTFGDKKCVFHHPIISIDFSSKFKSTVCAKDDRITNALCIITKESEPQIDDQDFEVEAEFVGRFNRYQVEEGFNKGGFRFGFVVDSISNIRNFTSIKGEKILFDKTN